jgi:hypothetical protein
MTLTGCFTTAGALIGYSVTSPKEVKQQDGTITTEQTRHTETGAAIGVLLDVVAMALVVSAVRSIPDEAIGRIEP